MEDVDMNETMIPIVLTGMTKGGIQLGMKIQRMNDDNLSD